MTVDALLNELKQIVRVHPEAKDAVVWAEIKGEYGHSDFHRLTYLKYDTKHHPARVILEEA